ncbi:MAG: hypothetical protein ACI9KE_005224 [Polyangiales bacterium]|jgi:hypothetical protein
MKSKNEKDCACGNKSVAYAQSLALNLPLNDGKDRCMPCQRARRAHGFRMMVMLVALAVCGFGLFSGDPYALVALALAPLAWAVSIPYLRSAESERGPNAGKL